ncbi:hypothetical protein [Qingshengfaniella alkalisoli]|uniref:hypothetical protein n=1 Tax=Qingshengfaniella alkalisoli TaxID=2599296 RepID=UPI00197B5204|nr:hypothetical protein [Qingshengfaniella alkalisoli]
MFALIRARGALLALAATLALSACGESIYAPDEVVEQYRYSSGGQPSIALVTNINNRTNGGAHSALIIDGPERVVFNPFGTWSHPRSPERNDVHFGFTPDMEDWFIDYHARETYRVVIQRVSVSPQTAAIALERAKAYGAVGPARCTIATSSVLHGLPGFESFPIVLHPSKAMNNFAQVPGVQTSIYVDDSPDNWSDLKGKYPTGAEIKAVPEQHMARAIPKSELPPEE